MSKRDPLGFVAEQIVDCRLKAGFIRYLDCGIIGQKLGRDFLEIPHVRAEHDRLGQAGRFDRVLAALRREAFAYEHDRSLLVKIFQLAGGVNEQAVEAPLLPGRRVAADLAAINKTHSELGQGVAHFTAALGVARHQNEKQIGVFFAQPPGQAGKDHLLAAVGAAANEQRCAFRHTQILRQV